MLRKLYIFKIKFLPNQSVNFMEIANTAQALNDGRLFPFHSFSSVDNTFTIHWGISNSMEWEDIFRVLREQNLLNKIEILSVIKDKDYDDRGFSK